MCLRVVYTRRSRVLEVKRLRQEREWNQTELAYHAGLAPSVISQIENGKRDPSARTLRKLADALKVEVGDLFPKAQVPLPLEELVAGAPLLEKVLHAARQDARKTAQAVNRTFSSEGTPQTITGFAEDDVRVELRKLGFPDAFFENLLWPLAERVVQLEEQPKVKDRETEDHRRAARA
jgi:transcriptional regulator with XRE-family HTH domain